MIFLPAAKHAGQWIIKFTLEVEKVELELLTGACKDKPGLKVVCSDIS